MATTIRPEISSRKPEYIDKHRYYELKHFCLQYPQWKQALHDLDGYSRDDAVREYCEGGNVADPTWDSANKRLFYSERVEMVERAAREAAGPMADLMLKAVTRGISYECLRARECVPCGREMWYTMYRRFFFVLSETRG